VARDRVLVLDADVNKRAATELRRRGRNATSVYTMNVADSLDPALLELLTDRFEDAWVLVTADDRMPYRHAGEVAGAPGAIATIDPRKPGDLHLDAWRRDVVHKWADRMQKQAPGSVYRYSMDSVRTWKPRAHYLLSAP
jgi:hypothetical protein